jgi:hypothetical protein
MGDSKEKIQKNYQVRITEYAYQNIDDITSYTVALIKRQLLRYACSKIGHLRKVNSQF